MSESGLGYRQRHLLSLLRARGDAVQFGWLVRQLDDGCPSGLNNTSVALRALRARGLVVQPQRGWWAAA